MIGVSRRTTILTQKGKDMKNRVIKLIVCIAILSSLMVGFCTSFASAEPAIVTRVKAGVAAVMLASQLVLNPVDVALSEPLASAVDPEGRIEWVETFPEYLERSKIRVYPDVVTIDGVVYSDIWLGPDAANSLRLKGLDFATAYNIANNQSSAISYASGIGYINSDPIYHINGVDRSVSYVMTDPGSYDIGGLGTVTVDSDSRYRTVAYYNVNDSITNLWSSLSYPDGFPISCYNVIRERSPIGSGNYEYRFHVDTNNGLSKNVPSSSFTIIPSTEQIDMTPFSFDYTSGVIDAPLDPEDGLLMRIPSSYTDPDPLVTEHNYDIHDLINIYPQVATPQGHEVEINPELNPDFQTDIDLGNGVGDLIRTILTLLDILDNVDIEFAPEPDTPEPVPEPGVIDPLPDPDPAPDEPISGTTIADTDWTKLDEILRWIQSTIDSIRHITESLQTMLDSLFDQLQNIIESLEALPEQLLEDIETGPSKVFRKALDVLKSLFLPLLLPIKTMMGLWHYVVEWIASINAPFLWIFDVLSGTSAYLVLPIYAVLAGSICIAIYKALGR